MCASMTLGRATAVHARRYAERAIREIKPPAILEPTREVLFPRKFLYDRGGLRPWSVYVVIGCTKSI